MKLIKVDNCSHKNISQASDTPAKLIKETKSLVRGFSYNNVGILIYMLKLFQLSKGMIKPIKAITVLLGLCVTLANASIILIK